MIVFLLFGLVCASVERWFARQPTEWARAASSCANIAVMFGDERWLDLTLTTAQELRPSCVALWLWLGSNTSAVPGCADALCYIDQTADASGSWGSKLYFNKISIRTHVMQQIIHRLPLDRRRGIALVDSDVVFFRKNALARFEKLNKTLVIQQEMPCSKAPRQICANGGLWWLRRIPESRALLDEVARLQEILYVPDQDALDIAIATSAIDVHYLDADRFPNGWTLLQSDDTRNFTRLALLTDVHWTLSQSGDTWKFTRLAPRTDPHLVHLNWMSFDAKTARAKQLRKNRISK